MITHTPSETDLEIDRRRRAAANRDEAIDTLARTLWGEARGEGVAGMEAVAAVIVNRSRAPGWWGRTITGVCLKPMQFSCWNQTDPNREKLLSVGPIDNAFAAALKIATAAVDGDLVDQTGGATNYHTIEAPRGVVGWPPKWAASLTETARIGNHVFYRAGGNHGV